MSRNALRITLLALAACFSWPESGRATTLTIQTDSDTNVWVSSPNSNFGPWQRTIVGRSVNKSGRFRGLLHFDLSQLPADAILNGVTLQLSVDQTSTDPLGLALTVSRLQAGFVEGAASGGVTWNTQPGVFSTPTNTATMNSLAGDLFTMDVQAVTVAALQSADLTNLWLRVAATDETTNSDVYFGYRTKEAGSGTDRAKLVIDYILPTPTYTPTPLPPPTSTATQTPTATHSGTPTITATATVTNTGTATATNTPDSGLPSVAIQSPADGSYTNAFLSLTVVGQATNADSVTVNGQPAQLDGSTFTASIDFSEGYQGPLSITAVATNAFGQSSDAVTTTIDNNPPTVVVGQPAAGAVVVDEAVTVAGMVADAGPITELRLNGQPIMPASFFSIMTTSALGLNSYTVDAADAAGNLGSTTVTITRRETPPEPIVVASAIDRTVVEGFASETAFLFTGGNPIQLIPDPEVIDPQRVAVLRGTVETPDVTTDLVPLAGVSITVLDHPELGSTATRADGAFDLAVNGGGVVTLRYEKQGYLSVQRQVDTPWRDYARADNVVMLPYDAPATSVDLTTTPSSGFHVASQAEPIIDGDGERRATLLFPAGTQASLAFPDGSELPLTHLTVKTIEYTVGPNGPDAMPAPLPAASAYTYAVELSIAEAVQTGASEVRFDRGVPLYVDNFLGFPTGSIVPVGYYDRRRATWVPSDNGQVIGLLSINANGQVEIDLDGDGNSESEATLVAFGITNAERGQLGSIYPALPHSVWRVVMTHFTPVDCNWSLDDEDTPTPTPTASPTPEPDDPDCETGSIIECQSQTLGERLPIVGTDFSLSYRSSRVMGRSIGRTLDIPLIGDTIPFLLERVLLVIQIAGQTIVESFDAQELSPNQTYHFEWDGRDVYGRILQGARRARVSRAYSYGIPTYSVVTGITTARKFGRPGGSATTVPARAPEPVVVRLPTTLLGWDAGGLELGGWSLDVVHSYDPIGRVLYRGDGTRRSAQVIGASIRTFAGTGVSGDTGDGGPATAAHIQSPPGLAVAPDGSVYFGTRTTELIGNSVVRAVNPDGTVRRVAGQGTYGASGDFAAFALSFLLASPERVALAPDGSLYIADRHNFRMVRLHNPLTGFLIERVAGTTGLHGYSGDGDDALSARLGTIAGLAAAPDGWVYIADPDHHVVRALAPDGRIWTVAGTGQPGYSGDGGAATMATLRNPFGLALAPDGSLFIADSSNHCIRRVNRNGLITTVAGAGTAGYGGDGGPAVSALLSSPFGVAVAPDGTLYIADSVNRVIRAVDAAGIITRVAGNGSAGDSGDGGPAPLAQFRLPSDVAVAPDGVLYVSDFSANRIRRIDAPLPGYAAGEIVVPSDDAKEVYVFDAQGRHLRTVNALTGATTLTFEYDTAGRLILIRDGDNNETLIVRDGQGNVTKIVAPYGQETLITLDANGYLQRVTNPADEETELVHRPNGLLEQLTDARNHTWVFDYDANGRLISDEDPAGGRKDLDPVTIANGYEVHVRTAVTASPLEERETTYRVEARAEGGIYQSTTRPDGTETTVTIGADRTRETTQPDGTVRTLVQGPDPRFGMLAPIAADESTSTGTVQLDSTNSRSAVLSTPDDPLSLTSLTETTTINGLQFARTFDAGTRTWTASSPAGRQTTTTIDLQGRVVKSTVTGLHPIRRGYDSRGRLSSIKHGPDPDTAETRVTSLTYKATTDDRNGYLDAVTDAQAQVIAYDYDDAGRVVTQTFQPNTPDERVIGYGYDENGNLTSVTPPGQPAHAIEYTAVNLEQEYNPPPVPPLLLTPQTTYGYNLARELTSITRPDGQTVVFGYEPDAGRLGTVTLQPSAEVRAYAYHPTGQLQSISSPHAVLSFGYDGSLPQSETSLFAAPAVSHTVTYNYDNNFRLQGLQLDALPAINLGYDDDSLLTDVGDLVLTRDPDNGLLTATGLSGSAVLAADTWEWSPFAELGNYGAAIDGTPRYNLQIDDRDQLGRILVKTETIDGTSTQYQYGYDTAGRLADVWRLSTPLAHLAHYDYDLNGNRVGGFNQVAGVIVSSGTSYDDQDRLENYETALGGAVSYTYAENGELASKIDAGGTTSYTYDALGNLRTVVLPGGSNIEYLVDGRNHRIGKKIDGVFVQGFLYKDQLEPVAELGPSGAVVAQFIYGSKPHVPDYMIGYDETTGTEIGTYRVISDHLGSPRLIVDVSTPGLSQAQRVVQRLDYDEFGNVLADTNPGFQPFGFAGGVYDGDIGFVRFGARDYDAQSGRWTAKEPNQLSSLSRNDLNLYGYALNDPVNFVDPNGRDPIVTGVHALRLFIDNFLSLRDANFKGADQYFHCKANCEAAKNGVVGEDTAAALSELRELADQYIKRDSRAVCDADRAANEFGRKHANPNETCQETCESFRPVGLPAQF